METTLVNWIRTFRNLPKECNFLIELSDGLILGHILGQLIPSSFQADVLKRDAETNDFLKLANLKNIVKALDKYYQEELGLPSIIDEDSEDSVDVNAIAKAGDLGQISRLVQLILGVAVECENKVLYIQEIMKLDPSSQKELMVLINGILTKHQQQKSLHSIEISPRRHSDANDNTVGVDEDFLKELDEEADHFQEFQSELSKWKEKYDKLKQEHNNVVSENANLLAEKESLHSMVATLEEALESSKKSSNKSVMDESFEFRQDKHVEEQQKLYAELEDKQLTIQELKKRVDELSKVAQEARSLRDENDILREKAAQVEDLEDRLKKVSKRADAAADLKKQLKTLEEQNENLLKSKYELEEETRKTASLKAQLEKYKDQVAALTGQVHSLTSSLEDKNHELKALQDQIHSLQDESKHKQQRIDQLSKELRKLQDKDDTEGESLSEAISGFDINEKLMRLEIENKRLRESSASDSPAMVDLENKLDDANRLNSRYSKEIEELKKKLRDAESGASQTTSKSDDELKELKQSHQTLSEQHEQTVAALKALESDNKKQLEEINNLLKEKQKANDDKHAVIDLNAKLKASNEKLAALTAEKTKLEGYLRTAKQMIREERSKIKDTQSSQLAQAQTQYEEVVQSLKNQLKDKERELAHFKNLLEESKESSSREQRLLSSAFYELGLDLQRLKAPKPPTDPIGTQAAVQPKSLLNQMRNNLEKKS